MERFMPDWIEKSFPKQLARFKQGDVIIAERKSYRHYGIYAGEDKVIHYNKKEFRFGFPAEIVETTMDQFARGDNVTLCKFKEKRRLYSRKETLLRAKSQIGKKGYNAVFNNCEHFARWCKTGRYESNQVLDECVNAFGFEKEPRRMVEVFMLDPVENIFRPIIDSVNDFLDKVEESINS
jgi:hypothetical protein